MPAVDIQEQLPVGEARSGNAEAWNALFARYQMPLYVYVFELVHDQQTSLDLVQETFINATLHIDGLRDEARFGSWLFGIAHQKVIQHWRRHRPHERLDEEAFAELSDENDEDPSAWLIRQEKQEDCMRQLSELSEEHRAVLLLYFIEDFSLDEIAVITRTQPGTVKSRMHYAKRALRKLIEDDAP